MATIANVATLIRGVSYKKEQSSNSAVDGRLPILRANNIDNGLSFEDLVYVDREEISEVQMLRADDILLAMSSGSKRMVGKSALVTKDCDYAFGAFCGLLRPDLAISGHFLSYFLLSREFRRHVETKALGTNINNLKQEHILGFAFALPPLQEQRRIIAKIEELFSELDKGVEALTTAREQLKAYRQSVLKHAFEGKLTSDWRQDRGSDEGAACDLLECIWRRRSKSEKPSRAGNIHKSEAQLPEKLLPLPRGWRWTRVSEFAD